MLKKILTLENFGEVKARDITLNIEEIEIHFVYIVVLKLVRVNILRPRFFKIYLILIICQLFLRVENVIIHILTTNCIVRFSLIH